MPDTVSKFDPFKTLDELEGVTCMQMLPLWGTHTTAVKYPDFFDDPKTSDLFEKMNFERYRPYFEDVPDFFGLCVRNRSKNYDNEIRSFVDGYDNPQVVVVGGGMITIDYRLSDLPLTWHFVDYPNMNQLRRKYLPNSDYVIDTPRMDDFDWINALPLDSSGNILFLFPTSLYFMDPLTVASIMSALADRWPGSHFVFDAMTSKASFFADELLHGQQFEFARPYYVVDNIDEEVAAWSGEDLQFNVLRSYSLYDSFSMGPDWDDQTKKLCMMALATRFYYLHHVYHSPTN